VTRGHVATKGTAQLSDRQNSARIPSIQSSFDMRGNVGPGFSIVDVSTLSELKLLFLDLLRLARASIRFIRGVDRIFRIV